MKLKKWELLEKKKVAGKYGKNLWKVIYLNPDSGKKEEFYLIEQTNGITVLALTNNNEVVTVKQYKQGCNKIILELPGGTVDINEKIEEAVKRELEEETGFKAEKIIFLGPPLWMTARNSWTHFYCFLALNCKKVKEPKSDESEVIETVLIPLKKWIKMTLREIEDPSTIVATYRSIPYLLKNGKIDSIDFIAKI